MKHSIFVALALLFFSSFCKLSAQGLQFPDCEDMEVTDMKFTNDQDSIWVTVFNDCGTCSKNVYTGILIYQNLDTLASNEHFFDKSSPDNNSSLTYKVKVLKPFSITDQLRVQMTAGLCDSIPIQSTAVGLNDANENSEDWAISPNPANDYLTVSSPQNENILNIKIYDSSAQLVKTVDGEVPLFSVQDLSNGVYYVVFELESEVISKKLVVNKH